MMPLALVKSASGAIQYRVFRWKSKNERLLCTRRTCHEATMKVMGKGGELTLPYPGWGVVQEFRRYG